MSQGRARLVALTARALSLLFVVAPAVAHACPVCFSAQNEENRVAFVMTTAFLTLLPLGMLGLGLGWAWRRLRRADAAGDRPDTRGAESDGLPQVAPFQRQ